MVEVSPSVDVIIPVYNGVAYVEEAIESVLEQTMAPKAIIVVDDYSTDETPAILKRYGNDIHLIRHEKNHGLPTSRNTGIRAGDSDLIAFLDADDKWTKEKLVRQVNEFKKNPEIGLCYTDIIDCDYNLTQTNNGRNFKKRVGENVFKELYLSAFVIPPSTVMVRREVFDVCGMFDESMLKAQDYECWLRIAMKYPISCIAEPLCLRRNNPCSITNTSNLEKSVYYTFRAFELCAAAVSRLCVQLPMPVEERKKLYLYRACRDSIIWGKPDDATFFYNKILDLGEIEVCRKMLLNLLKLYVIFTSFIKKYFKPI